MMKLLELGNQVLGETSRGSIFTMNLLKQVMYSVITLFAQSHLTLSVRDRLETYKGDRRTERIQIYNDRRIIIEAKRVN